MKHSKMRMRGLLCALPLSGVAAMRGLAASLVAIGTLTACSGESLSDRDTADSEEALASASQALVLSWAPGSLPQKNVKIARSPQRIPYEWDFGTASVAHPLFGLDGSQGNVCHGGVGQTTFPSCQTYTLPTGRRNNELRAVAIAPNTSHVYSWFEVGVEGLVYEGNSVDLDLYGGPRFFNNGSGFAVSTLRDVDVSPNGSVYYYWFSQAENAIRRSTGSSVTSGATTLVESLHAASGTNTGDILQAISFLGVPDKIEAWYKDGRYVASTNSLFLDGTF